MTIQRKSCTSNFFKTISIPLADGSWCAIDTQETYRIRPASILQLPWRPYRVFIGNIFKGHSKYLTLENRAAYLDLKKTLKYAEGQLYRV